MLASGISAADRSEVYNKVEDDSDPAEMVAEYCYDGLGRRIVKLIPNGENWDRTDYLYARRPPVKKGTHKIGVRKSEL